MSAFSATLRRHRLESSSPVLVRSGRNRSTDATALAMPWATSPSEHLASAIIIILAGMIQVLRKIANGPANPLSQLFRSRKCHLRVTMHCVLRTDKSVQCFAGGIG